MCTTTILYLGLAKGWVGIGGVLLKGERKQGVWIENSCLPDFFRFSYVYLAASPELYAIIYIEAASQTQCTLA